MFQLHAQLAQDCVIVGDLALCQVLLMNDAQYPWLILVPRRAAISEVFELDELIQGQLWQEVGAVAKAMAASYQSDKMNVAALGNVVAQLHVHVIARFKGDPAWPRPVWGVVPAQAYGAGALKLCLQALRELLHPLGLIEPAAP